MGDSVRILNYRGWSFTSYELDMDWKKLFDDDDTLKYLIIGDEFCPSTGKAHKQGFAYFKHARKSKKKFCSQFVCALDACAPIYSSPACNIKYCKKDGKFVEYGQAPKQGQRNDLNELKDAIIKGMSVDDLCMENPMAFHQYGRTLNLIADIALRKKWRNWMTQGYWFFGETGTGKSHFWKKEYNPETHYVVETSDNGWWDGYTGQEVVIFDEFRGGTPYNEILSLVNDTPKRVPRRGREPVPFLARKVIFTSALSPRKCYHNLSKADSFDQFYRRMNIVKFIARNEVQVNMYPSSCKVSCNHIKFLWEEEGFKVNVKDKFEI